MLIATVRGLTRSSYYRNRAVCLHKFYSDRNWPSDTTKGKEKRVEDDQAKTLTQKKIDELKIKLGESNLKAEKVREEVRTFFLSRFFEYVKNYDQVFARKYPKAFQVYRLFMDGTKNLFNDMKDYFRIQTKLIGNGGDLGQLTRKELEIQYHMPLDIKKVAPILLISSIPFAQYATMPLAFMFPRRLLSYQFWTLQQRCEFSVLHIQERLVHNRKVFRFLQAKLAQIKNDPNYGKLRGIFGKLGSGLHPTPDEIIDVQQIFSQAPFNTKSLTRSHVVSLCGMHGLRSIFFKRSKLANRAMVMHLMDLAIEREGGASVLSTEELRFCCFMRGLNASNLSNEELIAWLKQWIQVSKVIDERNFSLLLHLQIFLTYNHPNNWQLIYHER